MAKAAPTKAYCRACAGERNCDIRGEYAQAGGDENFAWHVVWQILQCLGCDKVFCRTVSTNSEDINYSYDHDGNEVSETQETYNYWPAKSRRSRPTWLGDFGTELEASDFPNIHELDGVMLETYRALDTDLTILSTIGLRTAFDVASSILGVDSSLKFEQKLTRLVEIKAIGAREKESLEVLIDAGNASAHRGWLPSAVELNAMVDVFEHFIEVSFVRPSREAKIQRQADAVRSKVPPKAPRRSTP